MQFICQYIKNANYLIKLCPDLAHVLKQSIKAVKKGSYDVGCEGCA